MIRVKNGLKKRYTKIRKDAKGLVGVSKGNLRTINQRTEKGLQYSYSHVRQKKREFRSLWIQRINAGLREHGMIYSQFMYGLSKSGLKMNRKVLSELVVNEPFSFKSLVDHIRTF